jgi:uncharacterized protein
MESTLARGIHPIVSRAWSRSAVVVLEGLRATGKTTLARQLVGPARFADLNDQNERERATSDLEGWVEAMGPGTVIDEAQLIPHLQTALKRTVDNRGAQAGQFFLTGSARLQTNELGGSDPLTGRVSRLRLHPFAQCERAGNPIDVVSALFDDDPRTWNMPGCDHDDIIRRAAIGGFPIFHKSDAHGLDGVDRRNALDDYVSQLFSGDIYQSGRDSERIVRLFRWITARSGAQRNYKQFADDLEMHRDTLGNYLGALFDVHLVEQVPGYRPSLDTRETERERLFVADPAFVAAMLPEEHEALRRNTDGFSSLLETFVATELIRLLTWSSTSAALFHWREGHDREVDLVLERRDGALIGIEVKAARSAQASHLTGLRAFRQRYGKRFVRGLVVHSGDRVVRFEDDLWAVPFSALWSIGAPLFGPTGSPESIVDRFRERVAGIRSLEATALETVHARSGRMDAVYAQVLGWFESFKAGLETAHVSVLVDAGVSQQWTSSLPPKPLDQTWNRSVGLRAGPGRGDMSDLLTVRGYQQGDGMVTWSVTRGGTVANETVSAEADHLAVVSSLLVPFVEELPAMVASFR